MKLKNISGRRLTIIVKGNLKTIAPDEIIILNYNSVTSLGKARKHFQSVKGAPRAVKVPEVDLTLELNGFTVKELRSISETLFSHHIKSSLRKAQIIEEIERFIGDRREAIDTINSYLEEVKDEG